MLEHELPCNRLRRRLRVEEHEERRGARSSKLEEHPLHFPIGRGSEWRHGSLLEKRQEGLETRWKMALDYTLLIT